MGFYKSSSTPLAALSEAIAKAGMIRGGSAQAHYRARRGYDRAGGRRIKANLSPGPAGKFSRVARASRASRYLLRRLNRNQSHSWGFGRRPDGSTAT